MGLEAVLRFRMLSRRADFLEGFSMVGEIFSGAEAAAGFAGTGLFSAADADFAGLDLFGGLFFTLGVAFLGAGFAGFLAGCFLAMGVLGS